MSSPTSTELPIVKKRGRPKTVNVDKKEYQKKYYEAHKDALLDKAKDRYTENPEVFKERNKQYMETLKETDNEKYQAIREAQSLGGHDYHKRQLQAFKIIKELIETGELTLQDTHKELLNKYNVIKI
jgi:nicotinamide riboside kinase